MSGTRTAVSASGGARGALLWTLLVLLVLAAWQILALWSASPYGRFLAHGGWSDIAALAALCRSVPQGDLVVPALLHAAAWVLMIAAMMLPTSFPLVAMFRRITSDRLDAGRLIVLVLLGFTAAWLAFGLVAHAADEWLRWAAGRNAWFVAHGWVIGASVLAGAGLFQWSDLKYRCLEQCHTPFAFVASRWHGRAPKREAFRLGLDHGFYCVGCCWALMLLMFVVGTGSIGWMLVLAAVMAAEKNLPWGRRLRTPLGVGLVAWAGAIAWIHV